MWRQNFTYIINIVCSVTRTLLIWSFTSWNHEFLLCTSSNGLNYRFSNFNLKSSHSNLRAQQFSTALLILWRFFILQDTLQICMFLRYLKVLPSCAIIMYYKSYTKLGIQEKIQSKHFFFQTSNLFKNSSRILPLIILLIYGLGNS